MLKGRMNTMYRNMSMKITLTVPSMLRPPPVPREFATSSGRLSTMMLQMNMPETTTTLKKIFWPKPLSSGWQYTTYV